MKKKYQNAFLLFGLVVLALMVSQLNFGEVWAGVQRAGYWFMAVVLLWAVLYLFNTAAWRVIIANIAPNDKHRVGFWWLYKITVTGFALNYATPGGLMGGEPYRIMSLSPKIGTEKASASVLLYAMTHIFSHFWFWLFSVALYVATRPMNVFMGVLLSAVALFCVAAVWLFMKGYRHGIVVSLMGLLRRFPLVKRKAQPFFESRKEQLQNIDRNMTMLRNNNPRSFMLAVALEFACRVVSALEIFFILLVIMPSADYFECILILAFTSLFANMLFFMPLQLGGREGGFLMSAHGLQLSVSAGIFVALLVRLRELIWTAIGLLLIKIDKKS